MSPTTRLAAAAAVALALAACADPKKKAAPDVSTPQAFCDAMIGTYAGQLATCYHATPAYVAAYQGALSCTEMEAFVAAGKVRYSPSDAADCLAAIAAAPCDGVEHAELLTPACLALVSGTVAPGGACALTEECAGGTCDTVASCSGTCVALVAEGGDCVTSSVDCAAGLLCDWNGGGTCLRPAPGASGQACGPGDLACQPGLFCDGGVCHPKLAAGASCLAASEAAPYPCVPGAFCHADSYLSPTRAECVPWVAAGAPCGEWVGNCGPGLNCVSGACTPDPTVGEPCSPTVPCLTGSWCDAGTCAAPKPVGATCSRYEECGPDAYCDGTTCVAERVCTP